MEGCLANVTAAACPSAFSGVPGSIFAQALTAVVAAHCAYTDDGWQWPPDKSTHILHSKEKLQYDFVVVGAGTAGSLLASRLSQIFPEWSILLIEAGDDPGPTSDIPSFFFANEGTKDDWSYKTKVNPGHCLGLTNGNCHWTKGKAMGGSSSINAMIYIRGHPKDYDEWAELGNRDWNYASVSKYFDILDKRYEGGIDLIENGKNPTSNLWYDIIGKAWEEFGLQDKPNTKNEAIIGLRRIKMSISDGRRYNTAKVNLHNVRDNRNIHVIKNTIVQKLIIDKDKMSATGIQIRHAGGIVMEISARKEIILSAGSIGTPQLLMLSGIGPKKHLSEIGLETVIDSPVGKNLQDHVFMPLFIQVDENYSNSIPPETYTLLLLQYMLTKTGPFGEMNLIDLIGFVDSTNKTDYPDIQLVHLHYTKSDNFTLKQIFQGIGYTEEILDEIVKLNKDNDLLVIFPILLHPKSRGELLLQDSDPSRLPVIKANYFEDPDDLETMIRGINFVEKILDTKIFKQINMVLPKFDIKGCADYDFKSNAYWECYLRHMATTIYHPVGTTKMGPETDEDSVVNIDLLVKGVKNLRVVDAGVMPTITSGNTMLPTMMIAEKAADLIQNYWEKLQEKDEL